jgi:hypothetical protein
MKYLIGVVTDSLYAWYERRKAKSAQKKKDQENKPKYDKAVNSGSDQEIENATEDYLNGD